MSRWVGAGNIALLTDFYELTMAAAYVAEDKTYPATFDLFVRRLPERRRFLVAAGRDDALSALEAFRFDDAALRYLDSLGIFDASFLDYLRAFRFSGRVRALHEGELAFPGEPLLSVTAPLPEAQLVETMLLNTIGFQTMIASKAARVNFASGEGRFVDFSTRRDHGADAALKGARAAYIGGAAATSLTLAGALYDIPVSGTMAHSFVSSYSEEADAFRAFARRFPANAVLLIDTYDTLEGARKAITVADELAAEEVYVRGVRIDSGDLEYLAGRVRRILDDAGHPEMQIFVSGDLDEYRIAEMAARNVPVDAYGVGTRLGTSSDAPYLGAVYKLVDDIHGPRIKLSTDKVNLPGRKQVYRSGENGLLDHDLIALDGEYPDPPGGAEPLLDTVMEEGTLTAGPEPLRKAKERCTARLAQLPPRLRTLHGAEESYPVRLSPGIADLLEDLGAGTYP
jgi:nicotinate phosphoribosyltransferase